MNDGDLVERDGFGIGRVFTWVDIDATIRQSVRYMDEHGEVHTDTSGIHMWHRIATYRIETP